MSQCISNMTHENMMGQPHWKGKISLIDKNLNPDPLWCYHQVCGYPVGQLVVCPPATNVAHAGLIPNFALFLSPANPLPSINVRLIAMCPFWPDKGLMHETSAYHILTMNLLQFVAITIFTVVGFYSTVYGVFNPSMATSDQRKVIFS